MFLALIQEQRKLQVMFTPVSNIIIQEDMLQSFGLFI